MEVLLCAWTRGTHDGDVSCKGLGPPSPRSSPALTHTASSLVCVTWPSIVFSHTSCCWHMTTWGLLCIYGFINILLSFALLLLSPRIPCLSSQVFQWNIVEAFLTSQLLHLYARKKMSMSMMLRLAGEVLAPLDMATAASECLDSWAW